MSTKYFFSVERFSPKSLIRKMSIAKPVIFYLTHCQCLAVFGEYDFISKPIASGMSISKIKDLAMSRRFVRRRS